MIRVSPQRAPMDAPVEIQLDGLEASSQVTVSAQLAGYGDRWVSAATFVADAAGRVNLGHDAPVVGSYEGVDGMGLFWSMHREPDGEGAYAPDGVLTVTLAAEVGGQVVDSTQVERLLFADGVTTIRVREDGLIGTFCLPPGTGLHPGLLVLGGSGGGLGANVWQAAVLARHGFATLALAYFAMESLPERLASIPLEYFERAIGWLKGQAEVGEEKVGVIGTSRGGELALLLGATFPEQVGAVVAYVPSHVTWRGFGSGPTTPIPSWTFHGGPIPMMRRPRPAHLVPPVEPSGVPFALTPGFLASLDDRDEEQQAAIPVERIGGPVLLISGRDDAMWPSTLMADRVVERLAARGHAHPVEHRAYAGAGHAIGLPYLPASTSGFHPVEKRLYDFGGTQRGTAHASIDSWTRVIGFLRESLGPPDS